MNLDADRLAQLAGLPATNRRNLSEASNRSLHDDSSVSDEQDHRFGKNQLAEYSTGEKGEKDPKDANEGRYGGGAHEYKRSHGHKTGDVDGHYKDYMEEDEKEEGVHLEGEHADEKKEGKHVVDIDEAMLAEEIARMRQERLQENELRGIIRAEIGSIISDLKKEAAVSKSRSKKRADKMRGVTMGIPGPGFR
tara:strand:+ start:880 stop:1458 length:579 start_codon:yes stop_codon:yes gene_type:complete